MNRFATYCLLAVLTGSGCAAQAQSRDAPGRLFGLVELRYAGGVGLARSVATEWPRKFVNDEGALQIRPTLGVRLGRHGVVGAGVGVSCSTTDDGVFLPLYVSGRLVPGHGKVRPELLLDAGYAPSLSPREGDLPEEGGRAFVEPGAGLRILTYGGIPVHFSARLAVERARRRSYDGYRIGPLQDSPPTPSFTAYWQRAIVVGVGVEF